MPEQIESNKRRRKRGGETPYSGAFKKMQQHRRERRKAKQSPDCGNGYRLHNGWEY